MTARNARITTAAILAAALLVPGCTNPLAPHPMDYGPRTAAERLRQVRPLDIGAFRVPEEAVDAEAVADAVDPDAPDPVAQRRAEFEAMERFDLTLEEARRAVLVNNLDLAAFLVDPSIAAETVNIEEGRFEAIFTLDAGWAETDSPTATALSGGQTRSQFITPGIVIPLRTGGTASVTLPIEQFQTDNAFSTLNPAATADLALSLSHDLLRNAGRRATTHGIRIAESNRQIIEARTKLEVIRQIAAAERSYWRLYAALAALEVRYQQYELARQQLGTAGRRVEAGSGAEIDVVRAESGVADRLDAIIQTHNLVLLQQRELKRILNIPGLDVGTSVNIIPATNPDPVRYEFAEAELAAAAVANRMEMLELELLLAQDAAQVAFEKNQALPLLALSYTYRVNGLGGTTGEAFDLLGRNRFEDWSVGLAAEVPLGNEQRESQVARAILTRLQRLSTAAAREQAIRQEVHDAVDQIRSGWQRILAGRQSVVLNTRALQAEQRQFDVGRTTSTNVLDADTRLAEARLAELEALTDYQIAQVDLAFATGTLLGLARVTWEPLDPRTGGTPTELIDPYSPVSGVLPEE